MPHLTETPDDVHGPIRILVTNMPGVLARVIANFVEQQPDMSLVGLIQDQVDVLLAAADANVVIVSSDNIETMPGICSHLLHEFPDIKVLVLVDQEDKAAGYWLELRHRHISHITIDTLGASIRWLHSRAE